MHSMRALCDVLSKTERCILSRVRLQVLRVFFSFACNALEITKKHVIIVHNDASLNADLLSSVLALNFFVI